MVEYLSNLAPVAQWIECPASDGTMRVRVLPGAWAHSSTVEHWPLKPAIGVRFLLRLPCKICDII